jgi:hypothetical protein
MEAQQVAAALGALTRPDPGPADDVARGDALGVAMPRIARAHGVEPSRAAAPPAAGRHRAVLAAAQAARLRARRVRLEPG